MPLDLAPSPLPDGTVRGVADIGFRHRDGETCLDTLYHASPYRVLFPRPEPGEPPTAAITTISGGVVGGDRLDIRIRVGEGARALVTTQAAEKTYRSAGPAAWMENELTVESGGILEWMPQETILFDGSRLRRVTRIHASESARILACEILVFGRIAGGEKLRTGLIRDIWDIHRDGRRLWHDPLHMDGDLAAILDHPAGFAGARAAATLVWIGESRLELARELLAGCPVRCGATEIDGLLVTRWLGTDALALRNALSGFWAAFRARVLDAPARVPRLWTM